METFSVLLVICAGNSPVTDEFPVQRPVTRSFDVFFDLRRNKRLSKQWRGWWLRRHCAHYDVTVMILRNGGRYLREVNQVIIGSGDDDSDFPHEAACDFDSEVQTSVKFASKQNNFYPKNTFQDVFDDMGAISPRPECVKAIVWSPQFNVIGLAKMTVRWNRCLFMVNRRTLD